MNKIKLGDLVYRSLKRRENELENEIKKLRRLERELEQLKKLIYATQNHKEELNEQRF